jgi:hypothetical protein
MSAAALMAIAAALYGLQIDLFHSRRDTFFYLLQDLAFIPIQVLLVTLVVDQFLRVRERAVLVKKMNMVIGAFFSEVGTTLLGSCRAFDRGSGELGGKMAVGPAWTARQFAEAAEGLKAHKFDTACEAGDLAALQTFLVARRGFLLGLLENQNLLEHETFTELLWAVFHLMEELESRRDLGSLSRPDSDHLAGDIKRAYVLLIKEWLFYMAHLKSDYPYLFSLAVRKNPFTPGVPVEIQ